MVDWPLASNQAGRALAWVSLTFTLTLACPTGQSQTTQFQWWPKIDTYIKLDPNTIVPPAIGDARLMFTVSRSIDGQSYNSAETGINLDITMKPLFRQSVHSSDSSKRRYLTFGIGYRYLTNEDKGRPAENRALLQLTSRLRLPGALLLSDRSQADLRVIGDIFSWRYRNRLTVERPFKIRSYWLTPYLRAEVFYDSRFNAWNKNDYEVGVILPAGDRFEFQPYYAHSNDSRSTTQHVNAVGFTVSMYFRR